MISSESSLATRKPSRDMAKKTWSRAARAVSRCAVELGLLVSSLHGGVWFCLLCFQPEPVPRSLPARSPQPPPKWPCNPPVWLRGAHHTRHTPSTDAPHFTTIALRHRRNLPLAEQLTPQQPFVTDGSFLHENHRSLCLKSIWLQYENYMISARKP